MRVTLQLLDHQSEQTDSFDLIIIKTFRSTDCFFSLNFWLQTPTSYSLLLYKLKFIEKRNSIVFATIQHVEIQNKSVGRLEEFKLPRYFCKQINSLGPAFVYTAADFTSIQNSTGYLKYGFCKNLLRNK